VKKLLLLLPSYYVYNHAIGTRRRTQTDSLTEYKLSTSIEDISTTRIGLMRHVSWQAENGKIFLGSRLERATILVNVPVDFVDEHL
jgi:hypothetical protein